MVYTYLHINDLLNSFKTTHKNVVFTGFVRLENKDIGLSTI
jgi:hypothetical protein